ncbi:hypothetical protein FQN54_006308 [Arachnomyces sp. PD_36]|nr:hypothetical protein FQN54_006308 [Arachnomyces sp. PD_36]
MSPHEPRLVRRVKSILASLDNLNEWEVVDFPSPLQSNFDYVYTIDVDAGKLIITRGESVDGLLQPFPRQISLSCLDESRGLTMDSLDRATDEMPDLEQEEGDAILRDGLGELDIHPGPPTALNELQFRICVDFCFVWKPFIDDQTTWRHPSMGFNTLAIGILRIAAWDLEVSADTEIDYPANGANFPRWKAPQTDVFWFHGYLVVFHRTISTRGSISAAVSKAQSFLNGFRKDSARLIILSLRHVAFVELSSESISCSQVLPLIVNTSALQCSPGFRLLTYVLSSCCWKPSLAPREQLGAGLPPEILDMVLRSCSPKDALALSQASFIFQELYYSTIPQFPDLMLQDSKLSVTCCGKKAGIRKNLIYCPSCYACKHMGCVGLQSDPPEDPWITCSECKEGKLCTKLLPGGVNFASRRYPCREYEVLVAGSPKILRLRRSMPTHLRRELWTPTNVPPRLVDFTIRFNGAFAGVPYGLDDS